MREVRTEKKCELNEILGTERKEKKKKFWGRGDVDRREVGGGRKTQ